MIDRMETKRLILRKARKDDLEMIWRNVWNDERIARTMLWEPVKSREQAIERMNKTLTIHESSYAYFVCLKETDEPIGFAGIKPTSPGEFEETGICIANDYQNQGYGKEVLQMMRAVTGDLRYGQLNDFVANQKGKKYYMVRTPGVTPANTMAYGTRPKHM